MRAVRRVQAEGGRDQEPETKDAGGRGPAASGREEAEGKVVEGEKMSEAKNYGFHTAQHLGTRESTLKERSVEQCLNCKRPECDGCPKNKEE